jgi:hypothetical protein
MRAPGVSNGIKIETPSNPDMPVELGRYASVSRLTSEPHASRYNAIGPDGAAALGFGLVHAPQVLASPELSLAVTPTPLCFTQTRNQTFSLIS